MTLILTFWLSSSNAIADNFSIEFYNGTFNFELNESSKISFSEELSSESISNFYKKLNQSDHQSLLSSLLAYKEKHQLNDWIYYQLIRKTAQQISPKAENYHRYTLYKWFLLSKTGYDARLSIGNNRLILNVKNDEDINDIPFFNIDSSNLYNSFLFSSSRIFI